MWKVKKQGACLLVEVFVVLSSKFSLFSVSIVGLGIVYI